MLCIDSRITDPYFNLAAEEYLLKSINEDVFMLWQSDPVVVSGKHQNILSEMNYRFVTANSIMAARRLTGGGTVYHDQGNLNFTFIRNGEPGKLVDFRSYTEPVIRFLGEYGLEAQHGSKHEILVMGKKVSGNAEHVYKNRVLHHGTLLFSADMPRLHQSIKPSGGEYTDKSVQSNRSSVINLADCLDGKVSCEGFRENLFGFIMNRYDGVNFQLAENELQVVRALSEEKYRSWDWIFGWSPDYSFRNIWQSGAGQMNIEFSTHKGIIITGNITSTIKGINASTLNSKIKGLKHREEEIREVLRTEIMHEMIKDDLQFDDLVLSFF